MAAPSRKPDWLKVPLRTNESFSGISKMIGAENLNTVCVEASCPNRHECWSAGTATFMILGDTCTRSCRFCNVKTGRSGWVDPEEPKRVARSVQELDLKHAVITSVNRDELIHGGAEIFAGVVREIRTIHPTCTIELLVPDFKGCLESLQIVMNVKPEIIGHNVETVPRLYADVRPQADYQQSLQVLDRIRQAGLVAKTSVMLGIGEHEDEVKQVMQDCRQAGASIFTLGQYLRPTRDHLEVCRWVHPDEFADYKRYGEEELGYQHVESGPLVRSSYHAEKQARAQGTNV